MFHCMYVLNLSGAKGEESNLKVQGNLASTPVWRTVCDCSFFTSIKTQPLVPPVGRVSGWTSDKF